MLFALVLYVLAPQGLPLRVTLDERLTQDACAAALAELEPYTVGTDDLRVRCEPQPR